MEKAAQRVNSSDAELTKRIAQARESLAGTMPLLDSPADLDLEGFERRLSAVEEKLSAALLAAADEKASDGDGLHEKESRSGERSPSHPACRGFCEETCYPQ